MEDDGVPGTKKGTVLKKEEKVPITCMCILVRSLLFFAGYVMMIPHELSNAGLP
jgi:hypothetical protein